MICRLTHPIGLIPVLLVVALHSSARAEGGSISYKIGTWLIDDLREDFVHTDGDDTWKRGYIEIAKVIEKLEIKLLVIQDVNAMEPAEGVEAPPISKDEEGPRSVELNELKGLLTGNFDYRIGNTGDPNRTAFFYDKDFIEIKGICEGKNGGTVESVDLFNKQPLYAHVAFKQKDSKTLLTDLFIIGIALEGGLNKGRAHHAQISRIEDELGRIMSLQKPFADCIDADELDFVLMGNFNADPGDEHKEKALWDLLNRRGWKMLAKKEAEATVLSGDRAYSDEKRRTDFIFVTGGDPSKTGGDAASYLGDVGRPLYGDEVKPGAAVVRSDIVKEWTAQVFRRRASNHVPVIVTIDVKIDDDLLSATPSKGSR